MNLVNLYEPSNKNLLKSISWLNKNIGFDSSVGAFKDVDLFTFLENVVKFDYDYKVYYDDIYYILRYTQKTILHLIENINKEIKRTHEIVSINRAKEFDKKTAIWVSRQEGISLADKLKENKILAVQRYYEVDTYENRIFKQLLKKLLFVYEKRKDLSEFDELFFKIRKWLRRDEAKSINEFGKIVFNNKLLHDRHYSKIFKSYKWLNGLNEKIKNYKDLEKTIEKFKKLTNLQFFSNTLILPSDIKINRDNFEVEYNQNWIVNRDKELTKTDRRFNIAFENQEVYIDLFRAYPVIKINNHDIELPLLLKQKIDNKIINANNTKIIDLRYDFFTLAEILKTYNTTIFKYFISDLENFFSNYKLHYIIPDYVDIFRFANIKKIINSYFRGSKNIPKSVVAGIEYIFENKVNKSDTLIYIQKDYENNLHITPLLVKYDKKLLSVTNGLYLERYPTRKLEDENNLLDELNKYFNENLSKQIFSKFLQNGIKKIKKDQIAFFVASEIVFLPNVKQLKKRENRINQIKSLYLSKALFKTKISEIKDDKFGNLKNFQKILELEKQGFILWKEHLPKLAMEVLKDGYYDEFILVDENSKVIDKQIIIRNHFLIPANTKELSFPLIFGDENIGYEAYIRSNEMPFSEDVECELKLIYDYEAENPYNLTFIPLDKTIKPLKVVWRKQTKQPIIQNLPYPTYPPKKSWEEFENYNGKNLINWIKNNFKYIIKLHKFITTENRLEVTLNDNWEIDKKGYEFQDIYIEGYDNLRVYKNRVKEANKISFNIEKKGRFYIITNIITDYEIQIMYKKRFPYYAICKDGWRLDNFEDENLKTLGFEAIDCAKKLLKEEISTKLKNELILFLTFFARNNTDFINQFIKIVKNQNNHQIKQFRNVIPYMIGCLETKEQKELLKVIINLIYNKKETIYSDGLKILGTTIWRCENIVYNIEQKDIDIILSKLLNSLKLKIKKENEYIEKGDIKASVVRRFELLLAILRYRKITPILQPNSSQTKEFLKIIATINKTVIAKSLNFKSYVELELQKDNNMPDLLYALRLYLLGDKKANSIRVLGISDD